jgi:Lipoprotein amino terminal region
MQPGLKKGKIALFVVAALFLGSAFAGKDVVRLLGAQRVPGGRDGTGPVNSGAGAAPAVINGWREAEARVYRARLATDMAAQDGSVIYQLAIEGEWQLTALQARAQSVELHGLLSQVTVKSDRAGADPAKLAQLGQYLQTPVLITLDPRGAVREVAIDPAIPQLAAGLLKSIVAYQQLSAPADAAAESWSAEETDSAGKYLAQYRVEPTNTALIHKQKQRYTDLLGVSDPNVRSATSVEVAKSEASFELERKSLRRVALEETLISRGDMIPVLRSTANFTLELTGSRMLAPPLVAALRLKAASAKPQPLFVNPPPDMQAGDMDRVRVAGRSFEDLTRAFAKYPTASDPKAVLPDEQRREYDELFSALTSLMRLDDDTVTDAMEQIREGAAQAPMLRDALWNAGTSYAQEKLVELVGFYKDEGQRRLTLIGMGQVQTPTPATVKYLESMVDDKMHGRQARLSLGSAAKRLRESEDMKAAEAIVASLTRHYQESPDTITKASYIDALGNTRLDAAKALIVSALESDDPMMRWSAVRALRHLPGADVDALIERLAIGDPKASVRNAAVAVIGERTPSGPLMQALDTLMRTDPEVMVRRSAVMAGVSLSEAVPELRNTLAWVAGNDPEPKMRELAGSYL